MKALSIRQPWAWLIAAGYKDIENRSWHTNFTGRIYIHAGKAAEDNHVPIQIFDQADYHADMEGMIAHTQAVNRLIESSKTDRGVILGEVDIVGCFHELELLPVGSTNEWFFGPHGFLLKNAELYDTPIPWKGQLGLFNIDDDELKGE